MAVSRNLSATQLSYSDYLSKLTEVHDDSKMQQPLRDVIEQGTALTTAAKVLDHYALNPLFIYEACSRLSQDEMANQYLEKFVKSLNVEVKKAIEMDDEIGILSELFSNLFKTGYQYNDNTLDQNRINRCVGLFNKFCETSRLALVPNFKSGSWDAVFNRVNILGKAVLARAKNAPAETDQQMINLALDFIKIPSLDHLVVLSIYESKIVRYSAAQQLDIYAGDLSNGGVHALLSVCKHLKELDLSGCVQLTSVAFMHGPYENINKVSLNNTRIVYNNTPVNDMFPNCSKIDSELDITHRTLFSLLPSFFFQPA